MVEGTHTCLYMHPCNDSARHPKLRCVESSWCKGEVSSSAQTFSPKRRLVWRRICRHTDTRAAITLIQEMNLQEAHIRAQVLLSGRAWAQPQLAPNWRELAVSHHHHLSHHPQHAQNVVGVVVVTVSFQTTAVNLHLLSPFISPWSLWYGPVSSDAIRMSLRLSAFVRKGRKRSAANANNPTVLYITLQFERWKI